MRRLIGCLDDLGVRATLSLNVRALEEFPDLAAMCLTRRWDVLSHGYSNSRFALGLDEEEERELIERCITGIERQMGAPPAGWMGPSQAQERRRPTPVGIRNLETMHETA